MAFVPKRVLVVTPHPDDAEIGSGGTLAKWAKQGVEVVLVVCTSGDKGSHDPTMTSEKLAAIREKEQEEAAKVLGIQETVFLRHPDGELEDNREFRGELVREIRRHKPEVVLSVDPHRRSFYLHRDHRIAGQVAMDAVFPYSRDHLHFPEHAAVGLQSHKVGYLYLWGSENSDTYVDVGDTMELKIEALKKHVSQVGPDREVNFVTFVRENARKAGQEQGMQYAEAFRVLELRR